MRKTITRIAGALVIGVFAMAVGVLMQSDSASAIEAKGGGTKCSSSTISGLKGTYNFCSSIYQASRSNGLGIHPYGRLYLPSSHDKETKLEMKVKFCNTSTNGTSCLSEAGSNAVQNYNITSVYNNGSCNSIIRGASVFGASTLCQASSIPGGQSSVAGKWYLAQSSVILNGTTVKTVNSPAQMAGN